MVSKLACFIPDTGLSPDIEIIDGGMILHHVNWSTGKSVGSFAQNLIKQVKSNYHKVIVVFDKYLKNSMKAAERMRRAGGALPPVYNLTLESPLPAKDIIMKNDTNKQQLIDLLCSVECPETVKLIVGPHEEADCSIICHLKTQLSKGLSNVLVRSEDTDVFLLLLHYVSKWGCSESVYMERGSIDTNKIIDITKTCQKTTKEYKCPINQLLAIHSLTGCDSSSFPFKKGKVAALNLFEKNKNPIRQVSRMQSSLLTLC